VNESSAKPKERSFFLTSLPAFVIAHATHHLLTALPAPMLPYIQQEFGLNYSQSAGITSAFSLSAGAAQLPAGWAADRIGPTILIAIGTIGVAAGGMLVGISHTYIMLIIAMIFMGVLSGGYHPASTPMISLSVPANQRGRALGIHQLGGNISFFLAPLLAGTIAGAWGWRGVYLAMAIPTAVIGIFLYLYLRRHYGKAHAEAMKSRRIEETVPQAGYKRRLIAFLVMMVLGGGAAMSVNAFLSLYMVNELGASKETAAMALSIVYSAGLWAGLLGGYISDRIGSTKVVIVTGILSGLMIFALKSVHLGFWLWVVLFFMGAINSLRMPVTEVFIMSQTPGKYRSTVFGVYYSTMQYTGAIFAPIVGGLLDTYGFQTIFTFSASIVTALGILTSLFIWDARS
jgi:MFS transporter, FSR family, fosmidomycin resistance protein